MMETHDKYMFRCLQLAALGLGYVRPNPLVGAILLYNDTIIGEGYHEYFGGPHAEVNCLNSVAEENKKLISFSTLYVTLEPCSHFGKTPPCSDLIIDYNIKNVVIGTRDPNLKVNGKGIEKLRANGIKVTENVLQNLCQELNKRFFTFHNLKRPYIILKWAQSSNFKIAPTDSPNFRISNPISNKLVHRWRSEEHSILVGTNTAVVDNPSLTNRLWWGNNPIRLLIDKNLKVEPDSNIFNKASQTIVFNSLIDDIKENIYFKKMRDDSVSEILQYCWSENIQSILVEGGGNVLQKFIEYNLWDETRVITNNSMYIEKGISAPSFTNYSEVNSVRILNDDITIFKNTNK
ncbi:MAG: bifunctional diaminohydroxyphosphoribosylaminopyrimidine deaminase/5-amino-6-(5-phosphoribosylamino)uracil reductase RibD [Ginsengibacter sp.]